MTKIRKSTSIVFDTLTIEGSLIAPAMLARISKREAVNQAEADYGIPKGLTIRDEMARYFRIGQALFAEFSIPETPSTSTTIQFTEALFKDVFGFQDIKRISTRTLSEQVYPVTLEALDGRVPIVIVPPADNLDRASDHLPGDARRRSAATAIQDWLNADDASLWGLCCNGESLRLVRDNASLTRPAYIEANLRQIFEGENFADFAALWLLIHVSRFGQKGTPVSDCPLERWRDAGSKEGVAARDRLRDGVEQALLVLGNGFLEHSKNAALKSKIEKGELSLQDYFSQLLRLVYRLIFLLAAEDRGLLHTPKATVAARKLYAEGYSLDNLRQHAVRRAAWDKHYDRWEGLLVVFSALSRGEAKLGLPALGGLFSPDAVPDLEQAHLSNRKLMEAIYRLAWLKEDARLVPINWRDMETEELGSVYESLLELTPRLNGSNGWKFTFAEGLEAKGNARKTTGSYYTPDSLVQALLDSALDPVLDRAERESDDPVKGLLSLSVIDPACGSGHFLLAAARRIASRVARIRAGGVASAEDYRHALRDVVRSCIYGVDRNPMAVELTKVALWIETVEPGKPLGFLDANIRCGDSLVGIFDLKALEDGIPDAAYKPLTGDDKEVCKALKEKNKANSDAIQHSLFGGQTQKEQQIQKVHLDTMPEETLQDIETKKQVFKQALNDPQHLQQEYKANLLVAAFFAPKTPDTISTVPTNEDFSRLNKGIYPRTGIKEAVEPIAKQIAAFHWPLEFSSIMEKGGFDIVLGNPPWEKANLKYEEFFQKHEPSILEAENDEIREKEIEALQEKNPQVYDLYQHLKVQTDKKISFIKNSGFLPLTSAGFINYYASFAELMTKLLAKNGRLGVILQSGIATDKTNEEYFTHISSQGYLLSFFDFVNTERIFKIHPQFKFSLVTISKESKPHKTLFAFNLTRVNDIATSAYHLSYSDITMVNPNTTTCPVFRTPYDAELTKKIYSNGGLFLSTNKPGFNNTIGIHRMFNATTDQKNFSTLLEDFIEIPDSTLPVYESKLIWQYDHRYATFKNALKADVKNGNALYCSDDFKKDAKNEVLPRWSVSPEKIKAFNNKYSWDYDWYFAIRMVTSSSNERTLVATIIPKSGSVNSLNLVTGISSEESALLLANLNSLIIDFITRTKVNSNNLNQWIIEQLPVLKASQYMDSDKRFIISRVAQLCVTSNSLSNFALELEQHQESFMWNISERVEIQAELDAWYARAYGLTRDELRYILDPADVMGEDYPSETFRVLKNNEIKQYGEYRTQRLVLEAWDRMETGVAEPAAVSTPIDLTTLPDGAWERPSNDGITMPQLAAIIKSLPSPTPIWKVRLAALYALEPRYLTSRLTGADRDQWQRLVGSAANPITVANVATLVSKINADWGQAVAQLRTMNVIDENITTETWAPSSGISALPTEMIDGWPIGRAGFVLKAIEAINFDDATTDLPTELQVWVTSHVAA